MGEKSEQKKQLILERARKVFSEKGFKAVTMKDIVEAAEISRGGLYLYFSDTKEIFLEVMKMETQEEDDVFTKRISEDATAADILLLFLKEQKKELLEKKDGLTVATYEYYFAHNQAEEENVLKKQFTDAQYILQKLIETGIESGEFAQVDAEEMASNIMFVIEGMRIESHTAGITEEMIDRQFAYFIWQLNIEE